MPCVHIKLFYENNRHFQQGSVETCRTNLSDGDVMRICETLHYRNMLDGIVPEDLGLKNPRDRFLLEGSDLTPDDHCRCDIVEMTYSARDETPTTDLTFEQVCVELNRRFRCDCWTNFFPDEEKYPGGGSVRATDTEIDTFLKNVNDEYTEAENALSANASVM